MEGRVAVVTGATSGVGRATARALAAHGFHVVLVVRDPLRGEQLRSELSDGAGSAEVVRADLFRADDVCAAASAIGARHPAIHLLVNNAGAVFSRRALTPDGHERTFELNVLAPFLLTRLLEPNLRAAGGGARVVYISSAAHHGGRLDLTDLESSRRYFGFRVYSTSKLALLLLCRAYARRSRPEEILHVAVHPGFVRSRFGRSDGGAFAVGVAIAMVFAISPKRAARTVLYAATSPDLEGQSGAYVVRSRFARSSVAGEDAATGDALWRELARLTGLPP